MCIYFLALSVYYTINPLARNINTHPQYIYYERINIQMDNGQTTYKNITDPQPITINLGSQPIIYSNFQEVQLQSLISSPGNQTIISVTIGPKWSELG